MNNLNICCKWSSFPKMGEGWVRGSQFGGMRLLKEYARMGVLGLVVKEGMRCVLTGRPLKSIYPKVLERVEPMLRVRYGGVGLSLNGDVTASGLTETLGNEGVEPVSAAKKKIWFCWMQGLEHAPSLVKMCYESQKRAMEQTGEAELVVIDANSYGNYVELPDYIVEKYRRGIIPHVLFSDLLRLELLLRYGGVWIDASVLCTMDDTEKACVTKRGEQVVPSWRDITNSELFVFQYARPGMPWNGNISNWFIAARPHNALLKEVLAKLYAYWRDYDCVVDYYMFHLFFAMAAKHYPEMIGRMPYGYSPTCLELAQHLGEEIDEAKWRKFSARVYWHKLNYRKDPLRKEINEILMSN